MSGFVLVMLGGLVLTVGDLIFKKWIESGAAYGALTYYVGMLVYLAGLVFLVESFKKEHMAVASAIFVIMNIVTLSLVSAYWFQEHLSWVQVVGLVCACGAIALLEFPARGV